MALRTHVQLGGRTVRRGVSGACTGGKEDSVQIQSAALVTSEPDYRNVKLPPI